MIDPNPQLPGEPARRVGRYEEQNVFGTPTGRAVYVTEGEILSGAPQGFTWCLTERHHGH